MSQRFRAGFYSLGLWSFLSYNGKITFLSCYPIDLFSLDAFNHSEVVKASEKNKGFITARKNNYDIRLASLRGYLNIVKYLVYRRTEISGNKARKEEDLDYKKNKSFENDREDADDAIFLASSSGNLELVKYLFEKNMVKGQIDRAFEAACYYGDINTVKYFLEEGKTQVSSGAMLSAIFDAVKYDNVDIFKYLTSRITLTGFALENSVMSGSYEVLKFLIDRGDVINHRNLIKLAIDADNLDMIIFLAEKGADLFAHEDEAFITAVDYGCIDIVEYLVEKGANIGAQGNKAIALAIKNENLEILEYLYGSGGDLDTLSKDTKKFIQEKAKDPDFKPLFKYLILSNSAKKKKYKKQERCLKTRTHIKNI